MTLPDRLADYIYDNNHYWFKEMLHCYFNSYPLPPKLTRLTMRKEKLHFDDRFPASKYVQNAYKSWLSEMITSEE